MNIFLGCIIAAAIISWLIGTWVIIAHINDYWSLAPHARVIVGTYLAAGTVFSILMIVFFLQYLANAPIF